MKWGFSCTTTADIVAAVVVVVVAVVVVTAVVVVIVVVIVMLFYHGLGKSSSFCLTVLTITCIVPLLRTRPVSFCPVPLYPHCGTVGSRRSLTHARRGRQRKRVEV